MLRIDSDVIRGIEQLHGGGKDMLLRQAYNGRKENPALLDKLVRLQLVGGGWGLHDGERGYLLESKEEREEYNKLTKQFKFNAQDFTEMKKLKDKIKEEINKYKLTNEDRNNISKVGNDDLLMFLAKLKVSGQKTENTDGSLVFDLAEDYGV